QPAPGPPKGAREKFRAWGLGKAFEQSAIIAAITPKEKFAVIGPQRISLTVGDSVKQDAKLSDLVWRGRELISPLSFFSPPVPGDFISPGPPAGVGPVLPGDS